MQDVAGSWVILRDGRAAAGGGRRRGGVGGRRDLTQRNVKREGRAAKSEKYSNRLQSLGFERTRMLNWRRVKSRFFLGKEER